MANIPGINRLFRNARLLGDVKAAYGGTLVSRGARRAGGRAVSRLFTMNVFGIIAVGEFFNWANNQVLLAYAEDAWVGSSLVYAGVYEYGFRNAQKNVAYKTPRPFLNPAARAAEAERLGANRIRFGAGGGGVRGGIYIGGRYWADLRAIQNGQFLGRLARRGTGAAASRLFWGTLSNAAKGKPFNVCHAMALQTQKYARQHLEYYRMRRSGALIASIAVGSSEQEMSFRSRQQVMQKVGIANAARMRSMFGGTRTITRGGKKTTAAALP